MAKRNEGLSILKEIRQAEEQDILKVLDAEMPVALKKVAHGMSMSEMKYFKEKGIHDLLYKKDDDGEKVEMSREEQIFDVVVPLLEMRGVVADELDGVEVSDFVAFLNRVRTLTYNPDAKRLLAKKS